MTSENIDAHLASGGRWFIKFYAPWCGHCKRMAPAWEEFGMSLPSSTAHVAELDCDAHRATCTRFGVSGFPTLKLIEGGLMYTYSGSRDVAAFTHFAEGGYERAEGEAVEAAAALFPSGAPAGRPAVDDSGVVQLRSSGQFYQTLREATTPVFVAFTAKWCGYCQRMMPEWQRLAAAMEGKAVIAAVDVGKTPGLVRQFHAQAVPTLALIRGGNLYMYEGNQRNAEAFQKFVESEYKNVDPLPVPLEPTWLEGALHDMFEMALKGLPKEMQTYNFVRDFDRWFFTNTATALVTMTLFGVALGFITGFASGILVKFGRGYQAKTNVKLGIPDRVKKQKQKGEEGKEKKE